MLRLYVLLNWYFTDVTNAVLRMLFHLLKSISQQYELLHLEINYNFILHNKVDRTALNTQVLNHRPLIPNKGHTIIHTYYVYQAHNLTCCAHLSACLSNTQDPGTLLAIQQDHTVHLICEELSVKETHSPIQHETMAQPVSCEVQGEHGKHTDQTHIVPLWLGISSTPINLLVTPMVAQSSDYEQLWILLQHITISLIKYDNSCAMSLCIQTAHHNI